MTADEGKRAAAAYAAELVQQDMVVGLGSGTTAEKAVQALGRRHEEGLRFYGVPTSKSTAQLAQSFQIPLLRLDELSTLDLYVDGADEVDPDLNLIKGHGGALVREKLVASSAREFVVIVDDSKLVSRLLEKAPIPIEVVPFGWTTTQHRLEKLGLSCTRRGEDGPYITANHNYILDCTLDGAAQMGWEELGRAIKEQTGVVDHGLFLGMTSMVVIGKDGGNVEILGAGPNGARQERS